MFHFRQDNRKNGLLIAFSAFLVLASTLWSAKVSFALSAILLVVAIAYEIRKKSEEGRKNAILIAIVAFLVAGAIIVNIRFFSGEDDWMCKDGKWIQHGNPSAPMPETPCTQ